MKHLLLNWIRNQGIQGIILIGIFVGPLLAIPFHFHWHLLFFAALSGTIALLVPVTGLFLSNRVCPWRLPRIRIIVSNNIRVGLGSRSIDRGLPSKCGTVAASTLQEYEERFGFSLRAKLLVLLFESSADLSQRLRRPLGGCAFYHCDTILLGADRLVDECQLQEIMRHEIAHLFSFRWAISRSRFATEGLATYLQGTLEGRPLEFNALKALLAYPYVPLSWLARNQAYMGTPMGYALAGCFTSTLIQKEGWEHFRSFYQRTTRAGALKSFRHVYVKEMAIVDEDWRHELMSREKEFGNDLAVAVRAERVLALYSYWLFPQTLELVSEIRERGESSARVEYLAACCHLQFRDFVRAIDCAQRALSLDFEPNSPSGLARVDVLIFMGAAYDAIGKRSEAIAVYEAALRAPDTWSIEHGSAHKAAKHYITQPFDMQKWFRHGTQWQLRKT